MVFILALSAILFCAGTASAPNAEGKRKVVLKSGLAMRYVAAGPESGVPLILLHGLGDTSRSWSLTLPILARRHRVYVLDQRGHGNTDAPACCYTVPDLGYDVIAFMDARKIDKAAVAGHSMGSFVAQHLAAAYPHRVSKLVLLGSSDTTAGSETVGWLWDQARTFDKGVPAAFVDELQSSPTPVDADFLAKVKAETFDVPPHVWKGLARMFLVEDHRRFLGDIKAPTLILWGEKDAAFPKAAQDRLQKAVPGAVFKAYPGVGHNLHWEIPRQVAEDIDAFLK
jgi:pimeloyl-ACP methyl ester carboxylesterase